MHSIFFDRYSDCRFIDNNYVKITEENINDIKKYFDKKTLNKKNILCNPDLSFNHINFS